MAFVVMKQSTRKEVQPRSIVDDRPDGSCQYEAAKR